MCNLPITLTRFNVNRNSYSYEDTYVSCLESCNSCVHIQHVMSGNPDNDKDTGGAIGQLKSFADTPTGWSFARWKRGTNHASYLIENHALVLEYAAASTEVLIDKLKELGWMHFLIATESRSGQRNTITVAIPLTEPVGTGVYARLASIIAYQLDEYGMEEGCLAPTHIVHVHRSSEAYVVSGKIMNPHKFKEQTKDDYQSLNARKFEKARRPIKAAIVHLNEPTWTQSDDGLFLMPETDAERILREAGIPLK